MDQSLDEQIDSFYKIDYCKELQIKAFHISSLYFQKKRNTMREKIENIIMLVSGLIMIALMIVAPITLTTYLLFGKSEVLRNTLVKKSYFCVPKRHPGLNKRPGGKFTKL